MEVDWGYSDDEVDDPYDISESLLSCSLAAIALLMRLDGVNGLGSEDVGGDPMFRKACRGKLEPRTVIFTCCGCEQIYRHREGN